MVDRVKTGIGPGAFLKLLDRMRSRFLPGRLERLRRRHLLLGRLGERIAENYLTDRGYELLCRNYRFRKSEIDLVMRREELLCFIEVKTRRWKPGVVPAAAVDEHKEEMLYRGGLGYLREIGSPCLHVRFDIVEVMTRGQSPVKIRHLQGEVHCFQGKQPSGGG